MGAESGVWKVKSGVWRVESGAEVTRLPPLQGEGDREERYDRPPKHGASPARGGEPQSGGGVLIKSVESGERRPMYISNF